MFHSSAAELTETRYIVATPNFYSFVSSKESSYENWKAIHLRIVQVCDKIWNEVKPVLCIDSPEGHTDEPIEELGVGPKDILSYSWRALRESRCVASCAGLNVLTNFVVFSCMPHFPTKRTARKASLD